MGIWDLDLCNVSKPCLFLKATEVINSQISLKQVLSARKHPYLFMSQQANRKCKSPASTSVSQTPRGQISIPVTGNFCNGADGDSDNSTWGHTTECGGGGKSGRSKMFLSTPPSDINLESKPQWVRGDSGSAGVLHFRMSHSLVPNTGHALYTVHEATPC